MTTSKLPQGARGYTSGFIAKVKAADATSIGVQLGLACIEHNVPLAQIAERLGTSRQSVYNWFLGACPRGDRLGQVESLIAQLRSRVP